MKTLYFDSAATTPLRPEVLEEMMPYFTERFYNPNSSYPEAVKIKQDIETARRVIAESINAEPEEIYFTSGGSEGNSTVIRMFCTNEGRSLLTTPIEHHSILEAAKYLSKKTGFINVNDDEWELTLNLYKYFQNHTNVAVAIIGGNNEIGTVQDLESIGGICKEFDARFHVDAVQLWGHYPIDVKRCHIDTLSASAHKIGGPKGCGFLYIRNGIEKSPIIFGTQEQGFRGGTLNVPGIVGMAKAISLCNTNNENVEKCRNHMIHRLCTEFGCKLNGSLSKARLNNNINVTFPAPVDAQGLIAILARHGLLCSSGSACNEGNPDPSHVLTAIGLSAEEASRTVRFTLPEDVTMEDIDEAITTIRRCLEFFGIGGES